jgi:SAM-dependent methyltransferase
MSYDAEFYKAYQAYLEETTVRRNHERAFDLLSWVVPHRYQSVLDLGCGTGEYERRMKPLRYFGVDADKDAPAADAVCDYTVTLPILPFEPTVFVSLFSTEACLPSYDAYDLYDKLFEVYPTIDGALVSGFYYEDKVEHEKVTEANGKLVSYQTTAPLHDGRSELFHEVHLTMRTPSKLFGDKVIEVWKLLERK